MIERKMDNHLTEDHDSGTSNRRNSKIKKTVRDLNTGTFELATSRDRTAP
ncbi:hypothetical protein [Sphingobacterium sp. UBA6320]|nr:hypothetical protein [Sphingobacterium sp. UBA6320]